LNLGTTCGSYANKAGMKIVPTTDIYVTGFKIGAGSDASKGYILNSTKGVLISGSISSNSVSFIPYKLTAGTSYYLAVDNNGASWSGGPFNASASYVRTNNTINYTAGLDCATGADTSSYAMLIANVSFYTSIVNLNSPTNAQIMTSTSVTTNATATVVGGAYLTNMTLYDNSTGTWGARNTSTYYPSYLENHGKSMSLGAVSSNWEGMKITMSSTNALKNVTLGTGCTATSVRLTNSGGSVLATASVAGGVALFDYVLTSGTTYRIEAGGTSYTQKYVGSATGLPQSGTIMTWVGRSTNGADGSADYTNVQSLGFGDGLFTLTQTFTNTYASGSNILWNVRACDSDGACSFAPSNYTFSVDSSPPTITVNYPTTLVNYGRNGGTLQLNYTATDSNLDKCWYNYYLLDISNNAIPRSGTESTTEKSGIKIYAKVNFNITTVTKFSTSNPTTAYILDSGKNVLATASFSSNTATFNYHLTAGNNYYIVADSGGSSYNRSFGNGAAVNIYGQGFNWTSGFRGSTDYAAESDNIQNISYSGININSSAVSCTTAVANLANITLTSQKNVTFYANDTAGNLGSSVKTWDYYVFENSRTFDSSVYETQSENYLINVSTMNPVTGATLYVNGVSYTPSITISGSNTILNKTIDVPLGSGNYFVNWTILTSDGTFNTDSTNQTESTILLGLCNGTLTTKYLNYTFKNETIGAQNINATLSGSFLVYLGSGSVNKTFTYTNSTENTNYQFCISPSNYSYYIQPNFQFTNSISQPRTYNPSVSLYTNSTTSLTLYLLPTILGTYAHYVTQTSSGQPLSGVLVFITRVLNGVTINIASGLTDSAGLYSVWLDPTVSYDLQFSKTGYATNSFSGVPNTGGQQITVYMTPTGSTGTYVQNGTGIATNLSITITPVNSTLNNNTIYTFTFNASGAYITHIYMNITDINGVSLGSADGTGIISVNINTSNYTRLIGSYRVDTSTESYSFTKTWMIGDYYTGDYSLFAFMTGWDLYGFAYDYWRWIIVLVVLISAIGGLSAIEVIDTNESKIGMGIFIIWAFSFVGWLTINIAIISPTNSFYALNQFANQFGIAILSTIGGLYALKEWLS
jgi:hypothetical protein